MMKRLSALAAVICLCMLVLAGCGSSAAAGTAPAAAASGGQPAAEPGEQTAAEAQEQTAAGVEGEVWRIPAAGLDIPLPSSWTDSGFYFAYDYGRIAPEMIITNSVAYAASLEEMLNAEKTLADPAAFSDYLDERVYDTFIILSVRDGISKEEVLDTLTKGIRDPSVSVELRELAKEGGWTFYDVTGKNVMRRPPYPAGTEKNMEQILADLPKMYENIRCYEPEEEPGVREGMQLSFETEDFDGNPVSSTELFSKNRYTMVNLWTSWCTFCVREMPELEAMSREFEKDGCAVIGIMLDGDEEKALAASKKLAEETGVTYLNLIPTQDMKARLIVPGYPTTVFVDAEGVVIGEPVTGMRPDVYRERMAKLISGE